MIQIINASAVMQNRSYEEQRRLLTTVSNSGGEKEEWYTYLRSVNRTTDYYKTVTGNIRVCNPKDGPALIENEIFCVENRLDKNVIRLIPGAHIESTIIVWIVTILLREQLQVPTEIVGDKNIKDNLDFFPSRDNFKKNIRTFNDELLKNPYNWNALYNASADLSCNNNKNHN